MASNTYQMRNSAGQVLRMTRTTPQGRKPSGLAKPKLVRLYNDDATELQRRADLMGEYWNENEFIRNAVHKAIEESRSIYTELLKT